MFCSQCGKQVAEEARFCMHCGAAVKSRAPAKTVEAAPAPLPANPAAQIGEVSIVMTGSVAEKFIPYAKNYGRGFRLFIPLLDARQAGTTATGILTVCVTRVQGPLDLRLTKPEDYSTIQCPGKPGFLDHGVRERRPYGQLTRVLGSPWWGVALNDVYFGQTPIYVTPSDFKRQSFTYVTTGAMQQVIGFEYTCPETVFVPADPYLHVWFLTSENAMLHTWRSVNWLDRTGAYI